MKIEVIDKCSGVRPGIYDVASARLHVQPSGTVLWFINACDEHTYILKKSEFRFICPAVAEKKRHIPTSHRTDRPDWSEAPVWANHLVMEGTGHWFWYEHTPKPSVRGGVIRWNAGKGRCNYAGTFLYRAAETLESRPQLR